MTSPENISTRSEATARDLARTAEVTAYRAALDELMQSCLASVRSLPLPADIEPLQQWNAHDPRCR